MEKYIPYEKLSKKQKRQLDAQKRGSWGGINPVTRKPKNSKAYNRSKARQWRKDHHDEPCFCLEISPPEAVQKLPGDVPYEGVFPAS